MKIPFNINSRVIDLELKPNETLLSVLRNNDYTEVKCGCNEGECGACLVLLNDKPVNSCQVLAMSVRDKKIKTVKGIGTIHLPHLIQKAFVEAGADQCGFCSPGMIIASYSILKETDNKPTKEDIKRGLDGNLCRCTGYVKIVEAVEKAAKLSAEVKTPEAVCSDM
ncbi:MAG: (2Fe-2S)-binding protein [Bacteroidota bacterium]|jgi:carbon-monoxide dehydrogenase small subunit|nr:(2Fe-2S)-binding protein [Ignavibacteria bacterium]MCU7513096.1 (2Fe-2S)-binding protein [Ignavibacteria bacterium]MCU7524865.1 (2Fe-2S)-binding protein [Ignavibacteria bacterium]HEX2963304.1 (2Fe-2S)-binding protein [Ignavibacteriales bacterium]